MSIAAASDVDLCDMVEAILYEVLMELYRRKKKLVVELRDGALTFHLVDAGGGNGGGGTVMTVGFADDPPWSRGGKPLG